MAMIDRQSETEITPATKLVVISASISLCIRATRSAPTAISTSVRLMSASMWATVRQPFLLPQIAATL